MKLEYTLITYFLTNQEESKKSSTCLQNMVGVNFKQNPSLRDRYGEYLQSRSLFSSKFDFLLNPIPLYMKVDENQDILGFE